MELEYPDKKRENDEVTDYIDSRAVGMQLGIKFDLKEIFFLQQSKIGFVSYQNVLITPVKFSSDIQIVNA